MSIEKELRLEAERVASQLDRKLAELECEHAELKAKLAEVEADLHPARDAASSHKPSRRLPGQVRVLLPVSPLLGRECDQVTSKRTSQRGD